MRNVGDRAARAARAARWALLGMLLLGTAPLARADDDKGGKEPANAPSNAPGKPTIADATKGAKSIEGLFNPYWKDADQRLWLVLGKQDLGVDFLSVVSIARGQFRGGGVGELLQNRIIAFRRLGTTLQIIERNTDVRANPDTPEANAVAGTYTDTVIGNMTIVVEEGDKLLVEPTTALMTGVFEGELPRERERSNVEWVKAFPNNMQIRLNTQVAGEQVELLLEFVRLPTNSGFTPRAEDDRIGYFDGVVEDYSTPGALSPRVRFIHRWKLEKVDPTAAVSDVKEPIVWWIERNVPREYRGYVREGILEWNKAFERAGFRNAIEVRQQGDADNFDANDVRYNVFRWGLGEDSGYAIAVSTAHPKTGQMLCGRVVFHEGLLRGNERLFVGYRGLPDGDKLVRGDVQGWLADHADLIPFLDPNEQPEPESGAASAETASAEAAHERLGGCCCRLQSETLRRQYNLACLMYNLRQGVPPGAKVPVEFTGQLIKSITMHEIGHCLGLRHNFKGSGLWQTMAQLADKDATAKSGLTSSVMDYLPPNLGVLGEPQGYYWTPTIGPYDYLAIEYGYKDTDAKGLKDVAARTEQPGLAYATDEDVYERASDPRAAIWDLGDPLEYAKHQTRLMTTSLAGLPERMVPTGESWWQALEGFSTLYGGFSRATTTALKYLDGWYLSRDHRGDVAAADPAAPAPPRRQREALDFLLGTVLTESTARVEPGLLRKLGRKNFSDEFDLNAGVDINRMLSNIQIHVERSLLSGTTVSGLLAQRAYLPPDAAANATQAAQDKPILPDELYDKVTDAIFRDLPRPGVALKPMPLSATQRMVQRDLVNNLVAKATGRKEAVRLSIFIMETAVPGDARTLARVELHRLQAGIGELLKTGRAGLDTFTAAHYEALADLIDSGLAARPMRELD
jgi:hypothetical protein